MKELDPRVVQKFSYGLFVLSAKDGAKDNGCIINTGLQLTSAPMRMSIAVNKAGFTHDMIFKTGEFNLSVLSQKVPFTTFQRFGFQSGRDVEKFEGYEANVKRSENGIYYVTEGTNAFMSGKVINKIDCGTHTLFIADIVDGEVLSNDLSATYQYYFDNIKPKPEAKPAEKKGWRCKVCGYVYEGEELPKDFICPICHHGVEDFERI